MAVNVLHNSSKEGSAAAKYITVCITLFLLTVFFQHNSTLFQNQVGKPIPPISVLSEEVYDLATLLNIPSFADDTWPDDGRSIEARAARAADSRPFSLLTFYRSIPSGCVRQPYKPHLLLALDRFRSGRGRSGVRGEPLVRRNQTLLIHIHADVATAKTNLSEDFVKSAIQLASRFSTVLLMPTTEHDEARSQLKADAVSLAKAISGEAKTVLVHNSEGQDEDLYLMHAASNLLVHRGAFSALGALVCGGTVYHTSEIDEYMQRNQFKWLVKESKPALATKVYRHKASLGGMGPVLPTCCGFKPFGVGDGEKVVCANAKAFSQDPCWVLSLGCNGKWSFEVSIAQRTNCKVHTFDCTGTWEIPEDIKERVTLHKVCLGQENDSRENFLGWNRIIELGSSLSGSGMKKMPALAKMDIEGHEFPVLRSLVADGIESMLPEQIALEVHSRTTHSVGPPFFEEAPASHHTMVTKEIIGELFRNLSTRGYKLVHRADNPFCPHCSEVTIMRDNGLPSAKGE